MRDSVLSRRDKVLGYVSRHRKFDSSKIVEEIHGKSSVLLPKKSILPHRVSTVASYGVVASVDIRNSEWQRDLNVRSD